MMALIAGVCGIVQLATNLENLASNASQSPFRQLSALEMVAKRVSLRNKRNGIESE